MTNQKVAVVTGSSSGIGLETSLLLARKGFQTFATMRNLSKSSAIYSIAAKEGLPLHVVKLDVNDYNSVTTAIQQVLSKAGRIDVLINNAGYALAGALEDLSMDELKAQFETNLFGVVRATQAVLPTMRSQGSGIIVNVSTLGGRVAFPYISAYHATKFALEGLTESVAYELEPFGIKMILIEPGFIKTNFSNAIITARKAKDPNSPYSQMMSNMLKAGEKMMEAASPPELVAQVIFDAILAEKPSLRYLAGKDSEALIETRTKMSDTEFMNMMKHQLLQQ